MRTMRSKPQSPFSGMNGTLPNRSARRNTQRIFECQSRISGRGKAAKNRRSREVGKENFLTQLLDDPAMNIPYDILAVMLD